MTTKELLDSLESIPVRTVKYTNDQKEIINHPSGPAWVLAGPGSGKTEILTVLVLRLLFVEDDPIQAERVPPESIFITTFTKKAARNLQDRISYYRAHLVQLFPSLNDIDISRLRIGTLQGLCNDLLQEFRYPGYQNVRLMDEFEQAMFVYLNSDLISSRDEKRDLPFWEFLEFMFGQNDWRNHSFVPNKWARTNALVKIFNRIVEDRISVEDMLNGNKHLARLAEAYQEYFDNLAESYRCDFAHLQKIFYEFLDHPVGKVFINGNGNDYKGIKWVLVDEYQDTNLIQEALYLKLANQQPYNIVVVGDDDQALYRFRGGSVECMVTFDDACKSFLHIPKSTIRKYPLIDNFRSQNKIVEFCNEFISSFKSMHLPGARVKGKKELISKRTITGDYPPLCTLSGSTIHDTAELFADAVQGLIENKIVKSPNQICLLMRSTKETPRNAGFFVDALKARGIAVYNPRNKSYLDQEEVQALLGAIIKMIDPELSNLPDRPQDIVDNVQTWITTYNGIAKKYTELREYINKSRKAIESAETGSYLDASLSELVYYILGNQPFINWLNDPVKRVRIGKLTQLIENYSSMPVPDYPTISRGKIRISSSIKGDINVGWLKNFYYLFIGYVAQTGLDDVEDEEIICPPDMVPVMTIHQAKGLEFPIVFVGHPNSEAHVSDSHHLEDLLGQFPIDKARSFKRPDQQQRAELDLIRQYYVAYSRPEFALIILGTDSQLRQGRIPCGPNPSWLIHRTLNL